MKNIFLPLAITLSSSLSFAQLSYPVVDTGVTESYSDSQVIPTPKAGEAFFGQDSNYQGHQPSYTNNGDGTVTDNVTGLMWAKNMGEKVAFVDAATKAKECRLGGHDDWRVPTIKELYSLILFTGMSLGIQAGETLFLDDKYFDQPIGDRNKGEREIDAQTWSSTEYLGKVMNADGVFGVNFVDGRIKGYPKGSGPRSKGMYVRLVRGNPEYGKNKLVDNGDGTITDEATGLMWQQADDGTARNWQDSLAYAEGLELAGYSDWRLPNTKELQSIVDYSRSPSATQSPAIDAKFKTTSITGPDGKEGYTPFFWTSTTHLGGRERCESAVYIAFGESIGRMRNQLMDVHGAGSQRSDPKAGDPANYPQFHGPQGDMRAVFNYVRCVRDAKR